MGNLVSIYSSLYQMPEYASKHISNMKAYFLNFILLSSLIIGSKFKCRGSKVINISKLPFVYIQISMKEANQNHYTVRTQRYCLFVKLQAGSISFQLICKDLKVNKYNYYHHDMKIRSKTNNQGCLQQYFHKIKESLEDQKKHILDMRKMTILFPFIKHSDPHTNTGQNQLWFPFSLCKDVDKDAIIKKLMTFGSSESIITPKKISKKQNDKQLNKHQPAKSANKRQQHSSKNVKRNTQRANQSRNSSESEHKDSEAVGKTKKIKKPDMKSKQEVKNKVIEKRKQQERKSEQCIKSSKPNPQINQHMKQSGNNKKSSTADPQMYQQKKQPIQTEYEIQSSEMLDESKQKIYGKQPSKLNSNDENEKKEKAETQINILPTQQPPMTEEIAGTKWRSDSTSSPNFVICGSRAQVCGDNQWSQIVINTPFCAPQLESSFKIKIVTCQHQQICVGVVKDSGLQSPFKQPQVYQKLLRHIQPQHSRYLIGQFNQGDIVECKIQWVQGRITWLVNDYKRAQVKVPDLQQWNLLPCIQMKTKGDTIRWLC